ncbi:MAG TPA: methionine adenosyltransferase [Longimicrobiales bacterium]|nr:methionine adenosyltransferase [Longimicrobiales bacterium]
MQREFILTSESVSEGHPDKVADRISDRVLDAHLARDPDSRVACETLVTEHFVCVAGEVRSAAPLAEAEIDALVRDVIGDIGYGDDDRFAPATVDVDVRLHSQSVEIAQAVDKTDRRAQGAGDQGMMFGYATEETPELMPAPITWAHRLTHRLAELRRGGGADWLRPDSKSQVSVRYVDGVPREITSIVVSTQHAREAGLEQVRAFVLEEVIPSVIEPEFLPRGWQEAGRTFVNPSGSFVEGGPATDTGLTGRKIIVDTYGGAARHGGGAFSGKDPSKVDRSAAYAARWVAKNVVAEGLARRCEIELAYAIGWPEPVAILVETFGTGREDEASIERWIRERFDLTPRGIIEELDLLRPIYEVTAAYGHFGREQGPGGEFPWEGLTADVAQARPVSA